MQAKNCVLSDDNAYLHMLRERIWHSVRQRLVGSLRVCVRVSNSKIRFRKQKRAFIPSRRRYGTIRVYKYTRALIDFNARQRKRLKRSVNF